MTDKPEWTLKFLAGFVAGLRRAIEVIDASEGDVDFAKYKLQNLAQEIDPQ
jgi:hypothetical protein